MGAPRLHALSRMVHTLLVNAHRTHELWPIFLAHVLEVREGGGEGGLSHELNNL